MGLRDNLKSEKAKERYDRNFNSVETTFSQKELEEHDKEIRAKAIDEFVERCRENWLSKASGLHIRNIEKIAEKMKGGGKNE